MIARIVGCLSASAGGLVLVERHETWLAARRHHDPIGGFILGVMAGPAG